MPGFGTATLRFNSGPEITKHDPKPPGNDLYSTWRFMGLSQAIKVLAILSAGVCKQVIISIVTIFTIRATKSHEPPSRGCRMIHGSGFRV